MTGCLTNREDCKLYLTRIFNNLSSEKLLTRVVFPFWLATINRYLVRPKYEGVYMRYTLFFILTAICSLSICVAADTTAMAPKVISISYYSITTTVAQSIAPATPATFTLLDNDTETPITATIWQYRLLGDTVWMATGTNSTTALISFAGTDTAAQYEVQAIRDGIPVTSLINVIKRKLKPLLVVSSLPITLGSADEAIKNRMGADIMVDTTENVAATGYNFDNVGKIVIAPSARTSKTLGGALLNVAKPILLIGFNQVSIDLRVASTGRASPGSTAPPASNAAENLGSIRIPATSLAHPLMNDKTAGDYIVYTGLSSVNTGVERTNSIPTGAIGIAQHPNATQVGRYAIVAMPAGGKMVDGIPAPAKRALLGFYKANVWTADAQGFFDAAYAWLDD